MSAHGLPLGGQVSKTLRLPHAPLVRQFLLGVLVADADHSLEGTKRAVPRQDRAGPGSKPAAGEVVATEVIESEDGEGGSEGRPTSIPPAAR